MMLDWDLYQNIFYPDGNSFLRNVGIYQTTRHHIPDNSNRHNPITQPNQQHTNVYTISLTECNNGTTKNCPHEVHIAMELKNITITTHNKGI
jgi:hypothetical protein